MTTEPVAVQAVVQWPRRAEAHGRYLVVADVVLDEPGVWPYAREEFVIGCMLEGGDAFEIEALGSTGLVLHRFGGTYGPVRFMVRAERDPRADGSDALRLSLLTEGGMPFRTMTLRVLPKAAGDDDTLEVETTRWAERPPPPRPRTPPPAAARPAARLTRREPRRSALLIGAPWPGGSGGPENDVAAMAEVLRTHYGFDHRTRTGEHTTRAAVLDAYEELIADTAAGDTVVVYLSGAGGTDGDSTFFVTADDQPAGRVAVNELDAFHRRLLEVCGNVTVIDDAGRLMERRPPDRPDGPALVHLHACGPDEHAYQMPTGGVMHGVFTSALVEVLTEAAGLQITWATLIDQVRRRVRQAIPHQRPRLVGPARRILFGTAEARDESTLPIVPGYGPGEAQILGAPLLNVQPGDEFAILPAGATGPGEQVLGTAVVDRVEPLVALARIYPETSLPIGARAYRTRAVAERIGVRLPPPDEHTEGLLDAVAASTMLRPADDDPAYAVRVDERGGLTIHDRIGPLSDPVPGATGIARVVADLERLARAEALRRLADDQVGIVEPVAVEFGRIADGEPMPLTGALPLVHAGDRIYVALRNDAAFPVFVSVVDIGIAAQVTNLTSTEPSGVLLDPGSTYVLGVDGMPGGDRGVEIFWPVRLDPAGPRTETILVITTTEPQDLSPLEQRGVRTLPRDTPLQQALAQATYGTSRRTGGLQAPRRSGYALRSFPFRLHAGPRPESAYLSAAELRGLCRDLRAGVRKPDAELVAAVEDNVATYRRRAVRSGDEPPEDLRDRLPLMGWLIYETALALGPAVKSGWDGSADEASRAPAASVKRLADAARSLPWPQLAPRAVGVLREAALVEAKRDTWDGYDAAWALLAEATERLRAMDPADLAVREVRLQVSLVEIATACRAAEHTVSRWDPAGRSDTDDRATTARLLVQLDHAVGVGEAALTTMSAIQEVVGFVDHVDENRLTLPTGYRNPALLLCRALLHLCTLGAGDRFDLLARWEEAFAFLIRPVVGPDGAPWPLTAQQVRMTVQMILHLAMIEPGHRLARPFPVGDRTVQRLDEDTVEFLSAWLAEFVDGRQRGDAGIIGSAMWPHYIARVEALGADSPTPIDYRAWRRRWFVLDRYAAEDGRRERAAELFGPPA